MFLELLFIINNFVALGLIAFRTLDILSRLCVCSVFIYFAQVVYALLK